jgi:hypothetical protein
MERFANDNALSQENVEDFSLYKALKDEAPQKAEELIAQIEGYAGMDLGAKIEALTEKEEELLELDKNNRYIAKEIARQREMLKAQMEFDNTMRSLERVA